MQGKYIPRHLESRLSECLLDFPAVAVLGPRQCGKTTLVRTCIANRSDAVYLDLERPSDLAKLRDPEIFFSRHTDRLVCLDEIQRLPEIFAVLRSMIDDNRRNGRFLILGSASPDLVRQSSETLAGRIAYLELTPFAYQEIRDESIPLEDFWIRGGFPDSLLARSEGTSRRWRENFIRTFLERDIPQLGIRIPAATMRRVWQMCAHDQGQILNSSRLGASLGVSHTTFRSYLDLLADTFMVRILPPYIPNLKKRLVKSPKIFLRDTGLLHSLLGINTFDELLGHPVFGASWETLAMETVLAATPAWEAFFYRTATGVEIDLVLKKAERKLAFEFKASSAPMVTKGFWRALDDLEIDEAWIVAPVKEGYPLGPNVNVVPLADLPHIP